MQPLKDLRYLNVVIMLRGSVEEEEVTDTHPLSIRGHRRRARCLFLKWTKQQPWGKEQKESISGCMSLDMKPSTP